MVNVILNGNMGLSMFRNCIQGGTLIVLPLYFLFKFNDLFGFNWQPYLIPDTGVTGGDDTVDDDLEEMDADELKNLLENDDSEEDTNPEEVEEETKEEEEEPPKSETKLFTQEDIDRIIGERLARERRIQEERAIQEADAGKQEQEIIG